MKVAASSEEGRRVLVAGPGPGPGGFGTCGASRVSRSKNFYQVVLIQDDQAHRVIFSLHIKTNVPF